jgi:predicted alpha/beta superfamily hydrolase
MARPRPALVPKELGNEFFPPIDTHQVQSQHVAQVYKLQVMQPPRRRGENTRYPVVYVTDGNFAFDVIKGISYSLQIYEPNAPRFMVVGIGYPGDDNPMAGSVLRARDLTFPHYPQLAVKPRPIDGVLLPEQGSKDFHGGEEFQAFIEHELVPMIDDRYPTLPGERAYFGHSAGGGFGLFTLFTRPELFSSYVISSPGLVFHGDSSAGVCYDNYDFLLEYARIFIESRRALRGKKLYMSVGSEEEFEPNLAQWQLTSGFYRMAALLRSAAIPGLHLTTEVLQGETHSTVWPVSFSHGIRAALFG